MATGRETGEVIMGAPLARSLALHPGETPASFVARLAVHHRTIPRAFCSDLGMRWPFLCSGQDDQIARLAQLTGADPGALRFCAPVKIGIGRYRVGGAVSAVGGFRRTSIRVCPLCATEALDGPGPQAVVQLLEWCVTCLHRCRVHGVALCALPAAATSHETYDVVAQVLRHHDRIRAAAADAAADAAAEGAMLDESGFEAWIRARIHEGMPHDGLPNDGAQAGGSQTGGLPDDTPQDNWLRPLELGHLQRACLTLGLVLDGDFRSRLVDIGTARERALCALGFGVLSRGPEALAAELDRLRSRQRGTRPWFSTDLGHFHAWLRSTQQVEALGDMRGVLRDHVFRSYPVRPDQEVLGARPGHVTRITFDEARIRSGLGVAFLKRLLGHLRGIPPDQALAVTEITLADLDRVLVFWRGLANLKQAAARLGIRPVQVKELTEAGVLPCLRFGSALRYVRAGDIADLLAGLEPLPEAPRWSGCLSLPEFCAATSTALARVVRLWRAGELAGRVFRGEGQGLGALRIDAGAICSRIPVHADGDLRLPDAARYLQISLTGLRKLRDAGLLREIRKRNPDTNYRKGFIARASLARFERRYVTLGRLAAEHGVAPMHLARRLDRDGIPAVEIDGHAVRVYTRNALPVGLAGPG